MLLNYRDIGSALDHDNLPEIEGIVRRQGFWHRRQSKLRESSAHLVGCIMRRVVCDASVGFRASFV